MERVLYRLPKVLDAVARRESVFIAEGEKDVHSIESLGLIGTCNSGGAGKWLESYSELLKNANVFILPDNDEPGRKHAQRVAASLHGLAASVKVLELPGLLDKEDVSDWLSGGHTREELLELAAGCVEWVPAESTAQAPPAPQPPASLEEVIAAFQRWLYLPDPGALEVLLGTVAANYGSGDPVWTLIVGPAGGGKTELLNSISGLQNIHPVAVLSEGSLLSGTAYRDKAKTAKGGLLREMGDFGILVIKDFGGILSMHKDARGPVLAALREVYDGSWTRHVGTDGGRTLHWSGKCGVVGGATPSIDGHYAVMASLGERFIFYRLPEEDE